MSGLDLALALPVVALALAAVPGTLELLLVTAGAGLGRVWPRRGPARPSRPLRLWTVVPAHNEQATIARCVSSLRACRVPPGSRFKVLVVADNCSDATAVRAREAGARVLVRNDAARRGKGYALDLAFRTLLAEDADAVAVVDADSVVTPSFAEALIARLGSGADAVQVRYGVLNRDDSVRTRLMHVALLAFNVLRPQGRDALRLSAGLLGNGFALSRQALERVPYQALSVVEDLEYHLRLVACGLRVGFTTEAACLADMPLAGGGVRTQRARWEGGRLRMLLDHGPGLAANVLRGRWRLAEPLLELLCLPLAFHVLLLGLLAAMPVAPIRVFAVAALAVVAAHILCAILLAGRPRDLLVLATAPAYIAWKLTTLPMLLRTSRRSADWVRTQRSSAAVSAPPGSKRT